MVTYGGFDGNLDPSQTSMNTDFFEHRKQVYKQVYKQVINKREFIWKEMILKFKQSVKFNYHSVYGKKMGLSNFC